MAQAWAETGHRLMKHIRKSVLWWMEIKKKHNFCSGKLEGW